MNVREPRSDQTAQGITGETFFSIEIDFKQLTPLEILNEY